MSQDQINGLIRTILAGFGGFVVAKGWFSADTWNWLVGGLAVAIPGIWSWISNRPAAIAVSAQALPGVTVSTTPMAAPAVTAAVAAAKATS